MYEINNKFDIGEECYTMRSQPVHHQCPICEGKGKFNHNGYEIKCNQCNGTGKVHNAKHYIIVPCKVKVTRIIGTVYSDHQTVKYKLKSDINIKQLNRTEDCVFKSEKEAIDYCILVNNAKGKKDVSNKELFIKELEGKFPEVKFYLKVEYNHVGLFYNDKNLQFNEEFQTCIQKLAKEYLTEMEFEGFYCTYDYFQEVKNKN